MKTILTLIVLAILAVPSAGAKDTITGKWYVRLYSDMKAPHGELILNKNGTGSITRKGKPHKLTWKRKGKDIHILTSTGYDMQLSSLMSKYDRMKGDSNKKRNLVVVARDKRYAEFLGRVECLPNGKCIMHFKDRMEEWAKKYNLQLPKIE
jgi:hypothetical protein